MRPFLRRALLALGDGALVVSLIGPLIGNFTRVWAGAWEALGWFVPGLVLLVVLVIAGRAGQSVAPRRTWRQTLRAAPLTEVTVLVAFALGAVLAGLIWRVAGDRAYADARAAAVAAGYRWEHPPSSKPDAGEDNAVTWLRRAYVTGRKGDPAPQTFLAAGSFQGKASWEFQHEFLAKASAGTLTASDLAAGEAFVAANRERLMALERAMEASVANWGIDYDKPFPAIQGPLYGNVQAAARLRATEAIVLAGAGRTREAADKRRAGFWLADTIASSMPGAIPSAMGFAVDRIILQAAETILLVMPGDVARTAWEASLKRDMVGRLTQALVWEWLAREEWIATFTWTTLRREQRRYWPFFGFDFAATSRYTMDVLDCAKRSSAQMIACFDAVEDPKRRLWLYGAIFAPPPPVRGRYVLALTATARSRLARLAIAAKEHRDATGAWPEALEAPKELRDPFTDSAFQIKRTETTLLLYSVGPNNKDDGASEDDIVWKLDLRVPAPGRLS